MKLGINRFVPDKIIFGVFDYLFPVPCLGFWGWGCMLDFGTLTVKISTPVQNFKGLPGQNTCPFKKFLSVKKVQTE